MSGASTMRNAVKRITHKERDQPSDRKKKFGHLEKHVDYKVRSDDYKKRKTHLKSLKKKAAERNPDEFYFKMNSSKVENGRHKDLSKSTPLDIDTVKIFKTQDLGYLNLKNSIERSKISKLKENLHFIDAADSINSKQANHKVFVDNIADIDMESSTRNDPTPPNIGISSSLSSHQMKSIKSSISQKYKELYRRTKRSMKLDSTIGKLNTVRNVIGKGAKRKIKEEDGTTVYKWKRIRAR